MPPETTATVTVGETPATPEQETPSPSTAPVQETPEAEPFDAQRAMRTIAQLRDFEKQAKAQAKELAELRKAKQEREEADLSESERQKRRNAELEAALADERAARRAGELRSLVVEQAQALGFTSPALAYRALDPADVKADDEGRHDPRSVKAALERLREQYPELADAQTRQMILQTRQQEAQRNSRGLPPTPAARTPQPEDGVAAARERLVSTGEYGRL